MEETADQRKIVVTFVAVALIAVIVVAAIAASPGKKGGSPAVAATSAAGSAASPPSTSGSTGGGSAVGFKDGIYSATGSYESPGGNENITVHVTLQNGVITATSADSGAQDPDAAAYQAMFISGYKSLVVGKQITSVSLNRVSGSSLTSQGFNEAISQIENQAKA